MARGDKNETKCKTTDKIGMGKRGSEESDEDYMVGEDEELEESEDEYCSSLAEEESDESLGEFEEEEEENDVEEFVKKEKKKVGKQRSGGGWSLQGTKKKGAIKQRKKKETYSDEYEEEDFAEAKEKKKRISLRKEKEDDDIWVYAAEDHDFGNGKPRRKAQVLSTDRYVDTCSEEPRKKAKVSYQVEEQDSDYEDSGDDDDVEFTPDEVDGVGDDEEVPVSKKNKMDRLRTQQTRISNGRKRKRNVKTLKKTKKMKATKQKVLRKGRYQKKDFTDDNPTARKKIKNTNKTWGQRQSSFNSGSDCGSLEPADFEYTMSEEEREQIREASEFCRDLATSLMSSNPVKSIEEEESGPSQRKCQGKKGKGKGKDKVVDLKIEVGKQVCGICLSEEGKRTVRGILNCCSHYFCFPCIMEWSKVESRCPLCKQRFLTINRTTRADGGHGLRDAVIQIPERDQVYQPTEEELRAYLDPYENVLCTECHQGGDDALMLLCDICDSPAHTYCVGLGREVPEGNWYCDGCKPTAFASNAQAPNLTLNCGANNNLGVGSSPVGTVRETFDLNELYIPETPSTQATTGHSPSIRNPTGYFQDVPSPSGPGVFTLFERRRIQRQIHQLLNDRARQLGRSENVAPHLGVSLFGSQICRDGAVLPQHTAPVPVSPQNIYNPGRLLSYTTPSWYPREIPSPPVFDILRGHVLPHQASTSAGHSFSGLSHTETSGANPNNPNTAQGLGHQPLRPCNGRSNAGSEPGIFQYQFREATLPSNTLQGRLPTPF